MAYSTWKSLPSGEKVFTPRSYSLLQTIFLTQILGTQIQTLLRTLLCIDFNIIKAPLLTVVFAGNNERTAASRFIIVKKVLKKLRRTTRCS